MTIQNIIVLQWTFSPPDYFEAPVLIHRDDYDITIIEGKIEARLEPRVYDGNPALKDIIEDALNDRFRGVQLISHGNYELSYAGRFRVHPDGHKEFFITMTEVVGISDKADIVATHDGNIIFDSHKERIVKKAEIADLAEKYGNKDHLARSLLASYHAAVKDPDNELIYLYEIREALARELGGEDQTINKLRLSKVKWRTLGRLADNEPIKQGRHRGRFIGVLRDATEAELKEAREIAQNLILAYLQFLEKH
jgi:hypothetical protein